MGRPTRRDSRSYSPPPPRRSISPPPPRRHYDEPRHRDRRPYRRSPGPTGLLVRNISLDARPEDLRVPFERFGPVKDVYLPKNYYSGEPRGFGFVKFRNGEDAAEAKHHLNHTVIGGREIAIVFAAENRKTPQEMRSSGRRSDRYGGSNRRSPPRSSRRRYQSSSRSPPPARRDLSDRDDQAGDYYSPSRSRSISRSPLRRDDGVDKPSRNGKAISPRRNDREPVDKVVRVSDRRSPSPRDDSLVRKKVDRRLSRSRSHSPPYESRLHSQSYSPR